MSNSRADTDSVVGSLNNSQGTGSPPFRPDERDTNQTETPSPRLDESTAQSSPLGPTLAPGPSFSIAFSHRHASRGESSTGAGREVTRPSSVIMDRKRRLTGSAYDQERRRSDWIFLPAAHPVRFPPKGESHIVTQLSAVRDSQTSPIDTNEIIDLTGDDDEITSPFRHSRNSSNFFLDGGEKVRLCNPCVPDPQPEPYSNFPPLGAQERRVPIGPRIASTRFPPYGSSLPFAGNHRSFGDPGHLDISSSLHSNGTLYTTRTRPGFAPPLYHSRHLSSELADDDGARLYSNPLPPLPPHVRSTSGHGRGRHMSLDSPSNISQSNFVSSPRMSSLVEGAAYPSLPLHFGQRQPTALVGRQHVNEEDICPICHRALPERGPNGDETAREGHIMACIHARDPESSSDVGSSSRGTLHMISFTASEKDCVAGDGNMQECSICMEEYDVGDELARLECWCKFHKRCIMSWLNKKAECPVHKMAAIHFAQD
ncbi:hypothetical protein DV738_g1974, partial [Chaetothyriales sp. CBS 135597]